MAAADMIIFMGCRAGSTTTSRWEAPSNQTRVLFFDNDPMVIGCNYQAEVGVVGDLKLALAAVNAVLDKKAEVNSDFGGAQLVADAKRRKFEIFNKFAQSNETPIRPERVIQAMNKVLPEDAVVVSDPGTSCPYYNAYYEQPLPGRYYITNRAHGALGYSLSASLGAWYGRPGSKVVAMMGDGSFGFTCGELETVCRSRANITFIVFSNSNFGWIKASQYADKDARYYNVDFSRTDHAAIAAAYGVKSWRVENPHDLERVLKEAIEHDGPTLIDVISQPLEETNAPVRRWMG
jgi:acetolactate synthase-1/2/3 large subunit